MTAKKVYILGIGFKPLDTQSGAILKDADVILTSRRLLDVFQKYPEYPEVKEKVKTINKVEETLDYLEKNHNRESIALLASGDPMFHGIGRRVIARCGVEAVEVVPDLSSIQVAFSRIRERWDDAFLMSLHGGLIPDKGTRAYTLSDVPSLLTRYRKVAILTDEKSNPAAIAETFLALPEPPPVRMFVCEKLGYGPEERITAGTPQEIAGKRFTDPNVVILIRSARRAESADADAQKDAGLSYKGICFGLKEGEIVHSRGLITKDEVRAVTLHKLRLPEAGVLWDIGAGSGSLSIEAGRLCPGLRICSVDRDDEQVSHMRENRERFGVPNMEIIRGEAPDILGSLPDPDRVCVGGSGRSLPAILAVVAERMPSGVVVINAVTLETVDEAVRELEARGFSVDVAQVSVSRTKELGGRKHLTALNPVFIVSGEKT